MNGTDFNEPLGERLGYEGLEQLDERAEAICAWEKTRIELTNHPSILARKAKCAALLEEERNIRARFHDAQPPRQESARKRKIAICWIVASVLMLGGFVLSLLTLEPFRLGLKGVFYCLGIAIATPFLVDLVLNYFFEGVTLRRVLAVLSCMGALVSLMLLASIRGNLMVQQTRQSSASVVINGEESQENQPKDTFYEDTVPLLQLAMILLAFAVEIGAGLAIHEAERTSAGAGEDGNSLRRELREVQAQLSNLAQEIAALESEGAIFVATFWRDFYWSSLKRMLKNAANRVVLPVVFLIAIVPLEVRAQQPTELVIALDLTKSVDNRGPDGETGFQKNVAAVKKVLAQIGPGTHVTVVGITDNSFGQPYILLSAQVDPDAGYFGERVANARRQLAKAWKTKSQSLTPRFVRTDVLGALLVAGQIFRDAPTNYKKLLVIFSDMRQDTREISLERPPRPVVQLVQETHLRGFHAELRGVDVYALGSDAPGLSAQAWQRIRDFWAAYLASVGASLCRYSLSRQNSFQSELILGKHLN